MPTTSSLGRRLPLSFFSLAILLMYALATMFLFHKQANPSVRESNPMLFDVNSWMSLSSLIKHHVPMDDAVRSSGKNSLSSSSSSFTHASSETEKIPIFYNMFVPYPNDTQRIRAMVQEVLDLKIPDYHGDIYIHNFGIPLEIPNTTRILHRPTGDEAYSLRALWYHCHTHPHGKVIYLHSKGSFHPAEYNENLRKFLTRGALSRECATLPAFCNVCSSRFSPFPHPHTSGNMWLARCDYVKRLLDLPDFVDAMGPPGRRGKNRDNPCLGSGRYAQEHWIHSHPTVRPCDLYPDPSFVWGFENVPNASHFANSNKQDDDHNNNSSFSNHQDSTISSAPTLWDLQPAPRFARPSDYFHQDPQICVGNMRYRRMFGKACLMEYKHLYNQTPTEDWWGWNFYEGIEWPGSSTLPK